MTGEGDGEGKKSFLRTDPIVVGAVVLPVSWQAASKAGHASPLDIEGISGRMGTLEKHLFQAETVSACPASPLLGAANQTLQGA